MKVVELIFKARRTTGYAPLETDELHLTALAWMEIIQPLIPLNRLDECYLKAIRNRTVTMPFSVSELCAVWNQIKHIPLSPLVDETERKKKLPTVNEVATSLLREAQARRNGTRPELRLEGEFWFKCAFEMRFEWMVKGGATDAELIAKLGTVYPELYRKEVEKYEELAAQNR